MHKPQKQKMGTKAHFMHPAENTGHWLKKNPQMCGLFHTSEYGSGGWI
ncbi:MAG TPA: hypothetical protein VFW42_01170 [Fluviicoccus sp.]|nr:hypothetical protein [Fluviicoccus sp.]